MSPTEREGGPAELDAGAVEPDGDVTLLRDRRRPGGWTLYVDGVPQSYVDLRDPRHLEFEYVRRIAAVLDAPVLDAPELDAPELDAPELDAPEPRRGRPDGAPRHPRRRYLHLGGGGLTLPRYVAATHAAADRTVAAQTVVERDAGLTALVLRKLPLPAGAAIEIVAGDARWAVENAPDDAYDVIVSDVYRAAQMPASVASVQFARHTARALAPGGRYVANIADMPPLAYTRRQVATLRTAFAEVCLIADPGMLRGRRYGNVVLAASAEPGGLPVEWLTAAVRRDPFPARVLHGADLARFVAGARPVDDSDAEDSPAPAPVGWAAWPS